MTSKLFSPLSLGPIELTNRIVVAPMCQYSAIDGLANDWHLQHLSSLGFSGAGLVMVEATGVEMRGRISKGCLSLHSDQHEQALKRVLTAAKSFSPKTLFGIQLAHAGRKAATKKPWEGGAPLTKEEGAWEIVAPSAIAFDEVSEVPKALEKEDLLDIISAFKESAIRACRVGFDVIEVHSAHGYLLHEFLSPLSNKRQDQYGGSLENRLSFPLEVVKAIRSVIPKSVALGLRLSATDWVDGGFTLDEAIEYSKKLKLLGVDYICASSGGIAPHIKIETGPGYQVPLAKAIRKEANMITRAVGMIVEPKQAEEIISSGSADFVALARGFLDDPRWGWHAADVLNAGAYCPPQYALARLPKWLKLKGGH